MRPANGNLLEACPGGGVSRVQPDNRHDSIRQCLIASLPRLQRFADLLAGDKAAGRMLLRRSLIRMLSGRPGHDEDAPTDRWAFTEIYQLWLEERQQAPQASRSPKGGHAGFEKLFQSAEGDVDVLTARFLWKLSVPERTALLLAYGEGMDAESAASVLGTAPEEVEALLVRANAALANRLRTVGALHSGGITARRTDGELGRR